MRKLLLGALLLLSTLSFSQNNILKITGFGKIQLGMTIEKIPELKYLKVYFKDE